jgi:hypothetical protein
MEIVDETVVLRCKVCKREVLELINGKCRRCVYNEEYF